MGVIFSDNFPGSSLDPEKWNPTAIGNTTYSVADNKLSITGCDEDTWFGDNVTQHGNQIRTILDLPDDYTVSFTIRAINNVSNSMGSNQVALVRDNGDIVVSIGYMDYEAGTIQSRRFCKAENNFSYKNPSWDQETSEDQILKPVSSDDSMQVTITKSGNTITISDETGIIGTVDITNTPSAIAILTGRYSTYNYFGTSEISAFSVNTEDTQPSEVVRVRSTVKILGSLVKRVRAKIWIEPDRRVFVRSKVKIVEQARVFVRAKIKIREANPKKRLIRKFVRAKVHTEDIKRVFVRAKVQVGNGETRIELYANVTNRNDEFNQSNPEMEFIVGDKRFE